MAPDLIPPAAWGAIGGVIGSMVTGAVTLLTGRGASRRDNRDGIRLDATYWQKRATDGDAERERLYDRAQALHEQVERLLHVNDAVMEHSQSVRTEVVNALPASTGPSDARLTP